MKFSDHPDLDPPRWNNVIWRYMSLDKFLDLLVNSRLFFANAQNLTDRYEVTLPENVIKRKELIELGFSGRKLDEKLATFEYSNQPKRESILVNCWSLGTEECYALWKIYLGGAKAGIAIRTNAKNLKKSIEDENVFSSEKIYMSIVDYKDYLPKSSISQFRLITTKRKFYKYEEELRLFMVHDPMLSDNYDRSSYSLKMGRYVRINLDILIEQLYISPFVGSWFIDTIQEIMGRLSPNLKDRIKTSSILDQ